MFDLRGVVGAHGKLSAAGFPSIPSTTSLTDEATTTMQQESLRSPSIEGREHTSGTLIPDGRTRFSSLKEISRKKGAKTHGLQRRSLRDGQLPIFVARDGGGKSLKEEKSGGKGGQKNKAAKTNKTGKTDKKEEKGDQKKKKKRNKSNNVALDEDGEEERYSKDDGDSSAGVQSSSDGPGKKKSSSLGRPGKKRKGIKDGGNPSFSDSAGSNTGDDANERHEKTDETIEDKPADGADEGSDGASGGDHGIADGYSSDDNEKDMEDKAPGINDEESAVAESSDGYDNGLDFNLSDEGGAGSTTSSPLAGDNPGDELGNQGDEGEAAPDSDGQSPSSGQEDSVSSETFESGSSSVTVPLLDFRVDLTLPNENGASVAKGDSRLLRALRALATEDADPEDEPTATMGTELGSVMESYLHGYLALAMEESSGEYGGSDGAGDSYMPLKGVDLTLLEENGDSLDSESGEQHFAATYSGIVTFDGSGSDGGEDNDEKPDVPNESALHSLQHQSLSDGDALLEHIQNKGGPSLSRATGASTTMLTGEQSSPGEQPSPGEQTSGEQPSPGEQSSGDQSTPELVVGAEGITTISSGDNEKGINPLIVAAVCVVIFAVVLPATTLLLLRRRRRRSNDNGDSHIGASFLGQLRRSTSLAARSKLSTDKSGVPYAEMGSLTSGEDPVTEERTQSLANEESQHGPPVDYAMVRWSDARGVFGGPWNTVGNGLDSPSTSDSDRQSDDVGDNDESPPVCIPEAPGPMEDNASVLTPSANSAFHSVKGGATFDMSPARTDGAGSPVRSKLLDRVDGIGEVGAADGQGESTSVFSALYMKEMSHLSSTGVDSSVAPNERPPTPIYDGEVMLPLKPTLLLDGDRCDSETEESGGEAAQLGVALASAIWKEEEGSTTPESSRPTLT